MLQHQISLQTNIYKCSYIVYIYACVFECINVKIILYNHKKHPEMRGLRDERFGGDMKRET